jgi:two-component system, NtrC family, response regulator
MSSSVLIVDDDPSVIASLGLLLKQHGYAARTAGSPAEALAALEVRPADLVLQDMNFSRSTSGEEGLELLGRLRALYPGMPVILITAWGSIGLAVQGMKAGAADFVTKPWSNAQLLQAVDTALCLAASRPAEGALAQPSREQLESQHDFGGLAGSDGKFLKVLELVARVAPTDASVLITGESGTGKELVAEAIHKNSRRAGGPFVKVNLGGISATLFESEMFGHVRGAFTDARADRKGRFETAGGGTIFLDEIGELDPSVQVKLLRVLQDRSFEVLGSSTTRSVDVRVVSATNRDLAQMAARGQFREDLLYRLNLITVRMPALRERRGDIPLLARHFLASSRNTYGRPALELDDKALEWLRAQSWPGNVRQLKQAVERAVLVAEGEAIRAEDLRALAEIELSAARDESALPSPGSMTLDEIERAMIQRSLEHFEGNVSRAAEALGLTRQALYRRLQKHGLES